MPILTACACGFRFKAPDRLAGRKARCPKCNNVVLIPAATAEATILEEAPATTAPIEESPPPDAAAESAPAVAAPAEPVPAPGLATSPDMETKEGPAALPPPDDAPPPPAAEPKPETPAEEKAAEKPAEAAAPAAESKVPAGKARATQRMKRDTTVKPAPAAKPAASAAAAAPSRGGAVFMLGSLLLAFLAFASIVAGGAVLGSAKKDEDSQKLMGVVILVGGLFPSIAGLLVLRGLASVAAASSGVSDRLGEIRDLLKASKEPPPAPVAAPPAPVVEPPKEPPPATPPADQTEAGGI